MSRGPGKPLPDLGGKGLGPKPQFAMMYARAWRSRPEPL
jgi:hypothetical protein